MRIMPGEGYPLGATCQPGGVNFALYSVHATGVVLLLFGASDAVPEHEVRLETRTRNVWHAFVAGLRAGQRYAYRVEGPYEPAQGLRFNPNKLLIDPYARALHGPRRSIDERLLGYDPQAGDLWFDRRDDADGVPKGVVVDDAFDWAGDRPPAYRLEESLVYEVHVKGFTAHPSAGVAQPGTYLGIIEKIPPDVQVGG